MAAVAASIRPELTRFEERVSPALGVEPAPVEEPMIYRGAPFQLARAHDQTETPLGNPVALTYRGIAFTAPSSPTRLTFGRRADLLGMIYRGTRIEG